MNYCPICRKESEFFDFGVLLPRPRVRCPHCGSVERHRLMWIFLNDDRWNTVWTRMLHFAPERFIAVAFRELSSRKYVTADIIPGIGDLTLDIQKIDLPDWQYDAVIASHVLEHVPDDKAALREIYRILVPGGWALLLVPQRGEKTIEDLSADLGKRSALFGHPDHVRFYGNDFADTVKGFGFKVDEIKTSDVADDETRQRCRLGSDRLYLCHKK